MKIAEEYMLAVRVCGYTEAEARFLYLVATHSGYFVPRQFLNLSGAKWGYRTSHFTNKLESRGHASWREFPGTGGVYHLCSRELYAKLGKENLLNRRQHSNEFIRLRLVLLDFIIENRQYDYLETEQQKVGYFCEELHLPRTCLPAKSNESSSENETLRHFADQYPVFLDSSRASPSPVVTFTYIDPGYASTAGFANHLKVYSPLLRQLSEFRFVFISNSRIHFASAEKCFFSLVRGSGSVSEAGEILRYFQLRDLWESKQYGRFSNAEMEWLNEATHRFAGERIDPLYATWSLGQVTDDDVRREFSGGNQKVEFATYLVRESLRGEGTPGLKRLQRPSVSTSRGT